jgi:hypothetical protein
MLKDNLLGIAASNLDLIVVLPAPEGAARMIILCLSLSPIRNQFF